MSTRFTAHPVRLAALLSSLTLLGSAHAADLDAQDALPAPAGTDAVLGYLSYASRSSFVTSTGTKIQDGTSLKSEVAILRYVHYMDVAGFRVAPQVLLPYARLHNASLAGAPLASASGMSDPIFAMPVWLVSKPDTNLLIVPYLTVPAGSYQAGRTLNPGEHRWKGDLQVAVTQRLGQGFGLQLSGDVIAYGENDEAGSGASTLKQDNTYQVQAWLNYVPQSDPSWTFSTGYSKYMGGKQRLDGIENGQATQSDQLRFEASKFVSPTVQVQLLAQRDMSVRGGFKEDVHTTLRVLKVF